MMAISKEEEAENIELLNNHEFNLAIEKITKTINNVDFDLSKVRTVTWDEMVADWHFERDYFAL